MVHWTPSRRVPGSIPGRGTLGLVLKGFENLTLVLTAVSSFGISAFILIAVLVLMFIRHSRHKAMGTYSTK